MDFVGKLGHHSHKYNIFVFVTLFIPYKIRVEKISFFKIFFLGGGDLLKFSVLIIILYQYSNIQANIYIYRYVLIN